MAPRGAAWVERLGRRGWRGGEAARVGRGKWLGQRDGARLRCCVGSDSDGAAQVERLK